MTRRARWEAFYVRCGEHLRPHWVAALNLLEEHGEEPPEALFWVKRDGMSYVGTIRERFGTSEAAAESMKKQDPNRVLSTHISLDFRTAEIIF